MNVTVNYTNSKGELFTWEHDHTKTLDFTVSLLRQHYDAVKVMIVVRAL